MYHDITAHCTLQNKKFMKLTQKMQEMQTKWHSFAKNLRQEYDKLLDEMV